MDREEITATLARRLVGAQFPQWAELPVTQPAVDGWDNVTFRLGENMSVRLPAAEGYAAQVDKEHRWLPILSHDKETRAAIDALDGEIDTRLATEVWDAALAAAGGSSPAWIHGDVSPTNLIVLDGRLSAVIDFGCSGVGDAAFDTEIAWGFLSGESRAAFRASLQLDEPTWARARGWRLRGALTALVDGLQSKSDWVRWTRRLVEDVLGDHDSVA